MLVNECLPADSVCKILEGKPCAYFRTVVLRAVDPNYPYAKHVHLYPKLLKLYQQIDPAFGNEVREERAKVCECGSPLKSRHRFCDKCSKKRRLKSERERQRKKRSTMDKTRTHLT